MGEIQRSGTEALAALLTRAREDAGLTRRELAERTGLSYPYVSQLETGYRGPSADAMQRLTEVLGVPVDAMVTAMTERDLPRSRASKPGPTSRPRVRSARWLANPDWVPPDHRPVLPRPRPSLRGYCPPRPCPRLPPPGPRLTSVRGPRRTRAPRQRNLPAGARPSSPTSCWPTLRHLPRPTAATWWPRSSPDSANSRRTNGWRPSRRSRTPWCAWLSPMRPAVRRSLPKPEPLDRAHAIGCRRRRIVHMAPAARGPGTLYPSRNRAERRTPPVR